MVGEDAEASQRHRLIITYDIPADIRSFFSCQFALNSIVQMLLSTGDLTVLQVFLANWLRRFRDDHPRAVIDLSVRQSKTVKRRQG
jgi:hypothetical protein